MDPISVSVAGLPGVVVLWILTLLAFGLFGWRVGRLVGLLRRARPENRFDQLRLRIRHFARHVLLQPRLFNERSIGLPHLLIFWGFVLYAACFNWSLVRGLFPFLPLPYPDEVGWVAFLLESFAVLVLISLAVAGIRRAFFAPGHLHLSLDANLILCLIGLLMLSTLLGQGFRLAGEGRRSAWSPLGSVIAGQLSSLAPDRALRWSHAMWWLHMVVVLGFLVYLPYSKHLHLLAAPFNVLFGNLRPAGDLGIAGATAEVAAGAGRWEELTWKQLLNGFACAECGRCDRACPSLSAGYELSPQQVVQKTKRHLLEVGLAGRKPVGDPASAGAAPHLAGGVISSGELWACTTCLACMDRCAVLNEQVPLILQMRRHLIGQGTLDRALQEMLARVTRYGNSFGKAERLRAKWTQPLGWKIKDARKEPVEYLWFLGDYAAYEPRVEEITRATARLFRLAGLDFGILYEGERNAGNDVRRVGEEGLFELLREKNLSTLKQASFRTIVTTDPHTYNTLKNEYSFNGGGGAVIHHSELLDQLVAQGRLPLKRKLAVKATYHDPCYLGRYNGVYAPPRRLLRALGVELTELPRNRNRSYCCGAGGGRIWMEDQPGIKERPSENRVREAAALPGVSALVVACPKDVAMFRDAIKTTGNETRLAVKDLAELVWEAVQ